MLNVNLDKHKELAVNSKKIDVIKGKKYEISTDVQGITGISNCGYFGVVFLDKNEKEKSRKIQWLNDFTGVKKKIKIICKVDCDKVILIYRINSEVPVRSNCNFLITPINKINLIEIESETKDDFDTITNFVLPPTKGLSEEEENILEQNIVWLIGVFRSGTTWVGTQLLSYKTWTLDESEIGLHLGSMRGEFQNKFVRDLEHFGNSPNYFFARMYKNTWLPFLRKLILNRLYVQFQDLSKKLIIKEPSASMIADIISECMPKAKIIFLLRDGRDIIDSNMDAFQKNTWRTKQGGQPKGLKNRLEFIERLSKGWVKRTEIMMNAFNAHPKEKRILVRYEDLRNNTLEELEKIYKFLEIEIDKKTLEKIVEKYSFENIPSGLKGKGKFARSASPGK